MKLRELLAQVRRIEITTGRLVNETFAGKYLSAFKGRGMEFAQVREYAMGDDVRAIDWNVTARFGRPYVREYQEERELTVVIACDLSGSKAFGSHEDLKRDIAAQVSAVMAFSALKNNDKVGLFLFTDGAERFVPPRKGHRHVLSIIRDLLAFRPKGRRTDIAGSLDTLNRMLSRRSIVVLVSDFQDEGFENVVRRTAKKHDLIPVIITDPRELAPPARSSLPWGPAYFELIDPETGERGLPDWKSEEDRSKAEQRADALEELKAFFESSGIDYMPVSTDRPFIDEIVRFFRQRARRAH